MVPFIIVGVIVSISFIFVAYILVTKFLCKEASTGVPFSAMTSNIQGKIKSSTSIKTVKTNEVLSSVAVAPASLVKSKAQPAKLQTKASSMGKPSRVGKGSRI